MRRVLVSMVEVAISESNETGFGYPRDGDEETYRVASFYVEAHEVHESRSLDNIRTYSKCEVSGIIVR